MFPLPLRYYAYIGLVLFGLAGFGYGKYKSYKLDAYIVAQQQVVQEKEKEYQAAADQIRKDKDAQIKIINNQLVDAISELRKRPSRADQANAGQNCNGTRLYSEDAEFLIREAARADEIRIALQSCYKQYDSLK
jgi:vacuolar-type H+-ATPase subunit F/Vma7